MEGLKIRRPRARRRQSAEEPAPLGVPARPGPAPSRDRVLATPELLEAILLHLPPRELLLAAQLVCPRWRDAVAACPRLQRHVFMRAEPLPPGASSRAAAAAAAAPRRANPLLARAFPGLFHPVLPGADAVDAAPGSRLPLARRGVRLSARAMLDQRLPVADLRDGRGRHRAFVRRGASWRRMLVSQPPPRRVGYLRVDQGRHSSQLVEVPGGLAMGLFFDMVCSALWGGGGGGGPPRARARDHEVSVCWEPALVGARASPGLSPEWTGTTPGFPSWWMSGFPRAWAGEVDVVFVEVLGPPTWRPGARALPGSKAAGAGWMFRCEEFEEVVWSPRPGVQLGDGDG